MELREAIRQSVEAFLVMEDLGVFVEGAERQILYGAVKAKLKDAASNRLAWEIVDFTPIAFARALLGKSGVKLQDHYVRIDDRGELRTYRKLTDEPAYREAAALASETQIDTLRKIARHSPEMKFINQALGAGSRPENLEASPPILNGPDELCDPVGSVSFPERPWWMDSWKPKKPWWKFW